MSGFLIAPAALGDLGEIWDHYAAQLQNPDAAVPSVMLRRSSRAGAPAFPSPFGTLKRDFLYFARPLPEVRRRRRKSSVRQACPHAKKHS
jgi:hypothetical protein